MDLFIHVIYNPIYSVEIKNMCECSTEKLRNEILKNDTIKTKCNNGIINIDISQGDSIDIRNLTKAEKDLIISNYARYEQYYVFNQSTQRYE